MLAHRRTSREGAKLFRAIANFFRQQPAAKMKEINNTLYLLYEQMKFTPSIQRDEVPEIRFFANYWVG